MNIYMYTVYTYLSVDIYECMSNVSITCSLSHSLYSSCYNPLCICHRFSLTPTCTLGTCNVHVCFPSITVALMAGLLQNQPGRLTPGRQDWCYMTWFNDILMFYDHLCNTVQVAAQSVIQTLQRARQHLIISSSFQAEVFHFTAPSVTFVHQGELFCHGPIQRHLGPHLLPDQVLSYWLSTRQQRCNTASLAGREIQCSQMCNLGKISRLIMKYSLCADTFYPLKSNLFRLIPKVWRSLSALSHCGREDDWDEMILSQGAGNQDTEPAGRTSGAMSHSVWLFLAPGAGLYSGYCSHQRFKVVSNFQS